MPDQAAPIIPDTCRVIRDGPYRGWVEMPRFALVDDHTYQDVVKVPGPNGETAEKVVPVTLDKNELDRIADTCNNRIVGVKSSTGDYSVICVGHTKDNLPTKYQPRKCGLAKDFAVQPFINPLTGEQIFDETDRHPKIAIYATPFCPPEELVTFLDHPRRSIELHFREGVIDPVALLSSEMPARDLGLHKFAAADSPYQSPPYRYSISDTPQAKSPEPPIMADDKKPTDMPPADTTDTGAGSDKYAAVFEDDRFKRVEATCSKLDALLPKLEEFLAESTGEGAEGATDPNAPPTDFDPSQVGTEHDLSMDDGANAPAAGQSDILGSGNDTAAAPPEAPKKNTAMDDPQRMSAAMSAPGATNCYTPSSEKGPKRMSKTNQAFDEAVQQAIERQTAAKFTKIERDHAAKFSALEQENAKYKALFAKAEEEKELAVVQSLLAGLDVEGYVYDPAEEIDTMVRMSKEDREKRLSYIRKVHKQSPIVPGKGRYPVPTEASAIIRMSKGTTPDAVPADQFTSWDEAADVGRAAALAGKSVKETLLSKRAIGNTAPSTNGVVQVR